MWFYHCLVLHLLFQSKDVICFTLGNSGFLFPVCIFSDYNMNYDWSVRADIVGSNGADVGLPVCTFSGLTDDHELIPLKIYYECEKVVFCTDGGEEGVRASNVVFVSGDCCALLLLAH